ncbi:MAG: hypothetical protein HC904_01550 [Blastochloris sp.]|nr:hypothetical protein [Blastochloris sp.]
MPTEFSPTLIYGAAFVIALILSGLCVLPFYFIKLGKSRLNNSSPKANYRQEMNHEETHRSLQNQILELQGTDMQSAEHGQRFAQLIQFLKSAKASLHAEAPMLDLYLLRLEGLSHSDPSQVSHLVSLYSWSQQRTQAGSHGSGLSSP